MATTTTTSATRKAPKPASGKCGLTLRINGTRYRVRPLPADFGGMRAFRLTKPDGEFHDIAREIHGLSCTCGDWVFRRDGIDEAGCKHVRAAVAVGLLDSTGGAR